MHELQAQTRSLVIAVAPGVRRQEIFPLEIELREPYPLLRASELRSRLLRERQVIGKMPRTGVVRRTQLVQTLLRILADGLQHLVAAAFGVGDHQ